MDPRKLADILVGMRKEDWLQLLGAIDPPLVESISSLIECDQPGDGVTTSKLILYADALNQDMRDAETYRIIPPELRMFLESSTEVMYTLGRRLTEAVNARDQVAAIREYLEMAQGADQKCAQCELMGIIEAIEAVVNSSLLDLVA